MPVLKRKVIRQPEGVFIEDQNEATKTKTVSVIPTQSYLICDNCGKDLNLRRDQPTTIECSQCGCPGFHTSMEFTIECVNCSNKVDVKNKFYGYCEKCQNKIWATV